MTVSSVLLNFKMALLTLTTSVERVGISWRRPDAYDEWDAIATTLFDNLVIEVLRWSLPEEERRGFRIPSYDLMLPSYAGFSTLEVTHRSLSAGRWLFHAFGTADEALDIVEMRQLADNGSPLGENLTTCPVEGADFCLRLAQGHLAPRILKEIETLDG